MTPVASTTATTGSREAARSVLSPESGDLCEVVPKDAPRVTTSTSARHARTVHEYRLRTTESASTIATISAQPTR